MLTVLKMRNVSGTTETSGEALFKLNPRFQFQVKAPMYWWIDLEGPKYMFNMPLDDFQFCFEDFPNDKLLYSMFSDMSTLTPRQKMQVLPLGTIVTASLELTYQEIIALCEDYVSGSFEYYRPYSFPNEREWKDFCETLLDIVGVRDLVKEEF